MRILETGVLPEHRVYRARCNHCQTLFEFGAKEARPVTDRRDGDAVVAPCPLCACDVWAANQVYAPRECTFNAWASPLTRNRDTVTNPDPLTI